MSDTGICRAPPHDISMIAAKLGVAGALTDIQNNHPNDMVAMLLFSRPAYTGEPTEVGAVQHAAILLGPKLRRR